MGINGLTLHMRNDVAVKQNKIRMRNGAKRCQRILNGMKQNDAINCEKDLVSLR
jgi:hypothetical protein